MTGVQSCALPISKQKDQKQQRLERTREHHKKLQLYKQHNVNKFISFSTHSKRQWTKCSNQKRHRVTEWGRKQDPSIFCLQETHFRPTDTFRLKVRGWRIICQANGHQKKARVVILISDNLDFKIKTVSRDAEEHYIIIKGSIHQEDLTIVNIYVPNVAAPKYINQLITNIKKLIDSNTIIVGDFNTHSQQWADHQSKNQQGNNDFE